VGKAPSSLLALQQLSRNARSERTGDVGERFARGARGNRVELAKRAAGLSEREPADVVTGAGRADASGAALGCRCIAFVIGAFVVGLVSVPFAGEWVIGLAMLGDRRAALDMAGRMPTLAT
jgi:hypothetical protein